MVRIRAREQVRTDRRETGRNRIIKEHEDREKQKSGRTGGRRETG